MLYMELDYLFFFLGILCIIDNCLLHVHNGLCSTLVYIHVSPVLVYNKSFYVCYTSWVYVINHVFICFRIKTTITSSKEGICGGFDNMLTLSGIDELNPLLGQIKILSNSLIGAFIELLPFLIRNISSDALYA